VTTRSDASISTSPGSRPRFVAFLAILLGTGCAPSQWEKPGGDLASQESDLMACRQGAHLSLSADPSLISRERPIGGGQFAMQSTPETDSTRQLREFQATQDCMRDKGYQLKPAPAR
jgi:hypothetical protein